MRRSFFVRAVSLLVLNATAACSTGSAPQGSGLESSGSAGTTVAAGAAGAAGIAGTAGAGGGAGGSGGSSGSAPVINTQAGTTGGGTAGAGSENCGAENHQAVIKPLAMYLLMDWSASMTEREDRWTPVATAVQAFVADPSSAGIKVALGYFPVSSEDIDVKCDPAQYVTPSVAMGALPDIVPAINTSFASKTFILGEMPYPEDRLSTPTAPAVTGTLEYLSGWIATNPDHVGVLVIATDGEPALCPDGNSIEGVTSVIAAAAAATPALKTYVIGIGDVGNLEAFAEAGDTGRGAFIVDSTGVNTQQEFLQTMEEIRGAALPCQFEIPLPTSDEADYEKVNVDFQPDATAATVPLYRVDDEAACAANPNSWHYDNPSNPTAIVLCQDSCNLVLASDTSNVSISLGCATRVK
jgi:hypothetical protein